MLSQKDQRLLDRLLHRDEKALFEFYAEHGEALLSYIKRSLDTHDAEEVLQDSFLACIESLRHFQGKSSLKTFLYSIAKRKVIDRYRRKRFKRVLFSYFPEYVIDSLAKVFLKDELDKKHLAHRIEKALDSLPHDYATVLRLKYVEDYTVGDIATHVDLSPKAAESLLFRARKAFVKVYSHYERHNLHPIEETF